MHPSFTIIKDLLADEYPNIYPDVKIRKEAENPDIYLVYSPRQLNPEHLNQAASEILLLCDGSRHVEQIVQLFRHKYPEYGEQESLVTIVKCLRTLQRKGILMRLEETIKKTD